MLKIDKNFMAWLNVAYPSVMKTITMMAVILAMLLVGIIFSAITGINWMPLAGATFTYAAIVSVFSYFQYEKRRKDYDTFCVAEATKLVEDQGGIPPVSEEHLAEAFGSPDVIAETAEEAPESNVEEASAPEVEEVVEETTHDKKESDEAPTEPVKDSEDKA